MSDTVSAKNGKQRFSIRALFGLVATVAIALAPVGYFGWKGIVSAICLIIAGALVVFGKRFCATFIVGMLLLGQIVFPALDGAREAVFRSECQGNIRKITAAIHQYEAKHGHLPPPFSSDVDGNLLHSWRVLILPFLGEQQLYDQIDKTKPWDDPVNIEYHNQMPNVFCCSAVKYHSRWHQKGNTTAYVVVVGQRTPWRAYNPPSLSQIPNGTSQTIAIIESENHRTNWMRPADPRVETFVENLDYSRPHNGAINISMLDGSTHLLLFGRTKSEEIRRMILVDDCN